MISTQNFPKITIVTPVKNAATTLEKAIKSLIDQNYPNLEYIIMDGASTDGTLDIIKKYEKYISYWQSSDDGSNVVAHVEGIKKASGEIIAFLNADDFYEAETLKKAAQAFAEDPNLDITSFRFCAIRDGKIIEETTLEDAVLEQNKIIKIPGMNARFFKRDLFFRHGFPMLRDDKDRVFISNDLEYLIRFALLGAKNKVIDYVGYNYIMHENSLTFSKKSKSKIRLFEDKIFIAKKFLNSSDVEVPAAWHKTFKKWIKKYRSMIVVSHLKQKNWNKIKENLKLGIRENGLFKFIFYLTKTAIRSRKEKAIGF